MDALTQGERGGAMAGPLELQSRKQPHLLARGLRHLDSDVRKTLGTLVVVADGEYIVSTIVVPYLLPVGIKSRCACAPP